METSETSAEEPELSVEGGGETSQTFTFVSTVTVETDPSWDRVGAKVTFSGSGAAAGSKTKTIENFNALKLTAVFPPNTKPGLRGADSDVKNS